MVVSSLYCCYFWRGGSLLKVQVSKAEKTLERFEGCWHGRLSISGVLDSEF